mgnify:CR=1 FL=1
MSNQVHTRLDRRQVHQALHLTLEEKVHGCQIVAAANDVRQSPGMLERMRQSMRRRCEVCRDQGGAHFEQLL